MSHGTFDVSCERCAHAPRSSRLGATSPGRHINLGHNFDLEFRPVFQNPHELWPSPHEGHGSGEGRAQGTFSAEVETPDQILGTISQDLMGCSRYVNSCRRSQLVR